MKSHLLRWVAEPCMYKSVSIKLSNIHKLFYKMQLFLCSCWPTTCSINCAIFKGGGVLLNVATGV